MCFPFLVAKNKKPRSVDRPMTLAKTDRIFVALCHVIHVVQWIIRTSPRGTRERDIAVAVCVVIQCFSVPVAFTQTKFDTEHCTRVMILPDDEIAGLDISMNDMPDVMQRSWVFRGGSRKIGITKDTVAMRSSERRGPARRSTIGYLVSSGKSFVALTDQTCVFLNDAGGAINGHRR